MGMQQLPEDLGKYIHEDVQLLRALGWRKFVEVKRGRGDFGDLDKVCHPLRGCHHQTVLLSALSKTAASVLIFHL